MSWCQSHYVYDIESYPNIFTLCAKHYETGTRYQFEISERVNDYFHIVEWVTHLMHSKSRMIGYNVEGYDYPMLHHLMSGANTAELLKMKSDKIINTDWNDRWSNIIWESDRLVPQIDLLKIHHFDNINRQVRLKDIEFALRMSSIQDLPFNPDQYLTHHQMTQLVSYNHHDVDATEKFARVSWEAIEFRDELSQTLGVDCTNFNDTKIGKQYFIKELEAHGIQCFYRTDSGRKKPRQTPRPHGVKPVEFIRPFINFQLPEYRQVLKWFQSQTIMVDKDSLKEDDGTGGKYANSEIDGVTYKFSVSDKGAKSMITEIDKMEYKFGLGGIHASRSKKVYKSSATKAIIDVDVTSYYPSVPISQRIFPEHLGEEFCDIYKTLKDRRTSYDRGTVMNEALKLALNGVFGDSNSPYSPFFDPKYLAATTINGQLMLAMLVEWCMLRIPGIEIIQANTDGITVYIDRTDKALNEFAAVKSEWQTLTGMDLEQVNYSGMWIRDVNNYVAKYEDSDKTKLIGAYSYTPKWHKDHSALVVPRVASQFLLNGGNISNMLRDAARADPLDFMLRAKVRRSDALMWGDQQVQSVSRYYVTPESHGKPLSKVMPPLARTPDKVRKSIICGGENVQICNNLSNATAPIKLEWYYWQVMKLVGWSLVQ